MVENELVKWFQGAFSAGKIELFSRQLTDIPNGQRIIEEKQFQEDDFDRLCLIQRNLGSSQPNDELLQGRAKGLDGLNGHDLDRLCEPIQSPSRYTEKIELNLELMMINERNYAQFKKSYYLREICI